MGTNKLEIAEALNKDYMDLYGDSLKEFRELPENTTFEDIKRIVATNTTIGYQHNLKIGNRKIIAERKYTWQGRVAKTSYLHIYQVTEFTKPTVLTHWREQKNGNFKTV